MNRSLLFLAALLAATTAQAVCVRTNVTRVYDGDTFFVSSSLVLVGNDSAAHVTNSRGGAELGVRVEGIDTPEIRGKCQAEKNQAIAARDLLRSQIDAAQGIAWLCYPRLSRYGRLSAQVTVGGERMDHALISSGLARPYDGQGPRGSWCD